MRRILVTGANGFVGRATCRALLAAGFTVRGSVRRDSDCPEGVESIQVSDIGARPYWSEALDGVDVIIHTAARVHKMRDRHPDPLSEFRRVNVDGTRYLAEAAATNGVRRLVFISTVKVCGEERAEPYSETEQPMPQDPYAISKWEAEQALLQVAKQTGLEVAILRPPLVYGPGVGANFLQLMHFVYRGVPLPLGGVKNRRSLIYVLNLVDAIIACASHPSAAGQVYFVSDGEDLSTPELVRYIAAALGRPARLLPVPSTLFHMARRIPIGSAVADRLTGSLSVKTDKIRRELSWTPPYTVSQGLAATAAWYLTNFAPHH